MKPDKVGNKNVSHVPIKDISKVISDSTSNKIAERKIKTQNVAKPVAPVAKEPEAEVKKDAPLECKSDSNVNKKMKFSESRKSPVIGSFTPMTFHSTPNKEGRPLTKTMVDLQLHPNRHSDNVKKTIEVHTDSVKQRPLATSGKSTKDVIDEKEKQVEVEKELIGNKNDLISLNPDNKDTTEQVSNEIKIDEENVEEDKLVIDETNEILEKGSEEIVTAEPNKEEKSEQDILKDKTSDVKTILRDDTNISDETVNKSPKQTETTNLNEEIGTHVDVDTKRKELCTESKSLKMVELEDQQIKTVASKQLPESEIKIVPEGKPNINIDNKIMDTKLQEQEKSNPDPVVESKTENTKTENKESSLNNEPVKHVLEISNKKSSEMIDKTVSVPVAENKTNEKEKEQEIKVDSTKDSKKQESGDNPLSKEVSNLNIQNAESHKNNSELPKKNEEIVVEAATEPEKCIDNKKLDKIQEVQPEKLSSTGAESVQKKSETTKIDEKLTAAAEKDLKRTAADIINKQAIDLIVSPITNVASIPPQPLKIASKVEVKEKDLKPIIKHQDIKQNTTQSNKNDPADRKLVPKVATNSEQKPINNNHAPVPFGKWTDVNRQAFLNKIKESKVPTNSSNGKQIKNSNDLNRRDVLKKIDSQRQAQELANMSRLGVKKETAFASKSSVPQESKSNVKTEIPILKNNSLAAKKVTKQETAAKPQTVTTNALASAVKKEATQRKEINNQDLIDKTIEGIINRAVPAKSSQEENNSSVAKELSSNPKTKDSKPQINVEKPNTQPTLDAIEMQMNELHGIPFIERPPHELPHVPKSSTKSFPKIESQKAVNPANKPSKIPNLLPFVTKTQKDVKENVIDVDSEDEVIEHEPITGDMDLSKKQTAKLLVPEKPPLTETMTLISADSSKKETIITEKDFDKFVRRNSINYENCLTVNFDSKEPHHVVQTIVQKDSGLKIYSKSEALQPEAKPLSPQKPEQITQNSLSKSIHTTKFGNLIGDDENDCSKNYQSKVKMAYQTAMTAKRQLERPISIIEDRPVKVVYMDSNTEYISTQLNVQGQELSPTKKPGNDLITTQISDSLDSDTLDSIDEGKPLDETKVKTKHQRKQVLTPVETPELELIAPDDLGIEVSPKKKRRTEEKPDKNTKTLLPKKTYLLGRGIQTDDSASKAFDLSKASQRDSPKQETPAVSHKNTASAIDSLVKAAELLETQSVNISSKSPEAPLTPDSQQNTPIKRGRGRPRKYPLPDGATDKTKVPSPQKKPRLIDAKVVKNKDTDDDDDSTDDEMVKENWTMGKINENIVCPICNKLFRSENVVFKHVKHCTGPSPSRSDSDNKSPRRLRDSQESETKSYESKSEDMDLDDIESSHKDVRKKRKSKDSSSKFVGDKDDVIVIEDTPIKAKIDKRDDAKPSELKKTKHKVPDKVSSLVCEFCGKTFRQLSYLVNHKLQHGKDDIKKHEEDTTKTTKSVFSCEVCKKEFRKLHHLVQHRIIHNPSSVTAKPPRKSSSEQNDIKVPKEQNPSKLNDDPSTGFRCEPCDKSFRKLHHLVEHRETHDGKNRQKITTTAPTNTEKLPPPPPQCDICKKTFRKLHHLIEHKEQHLETSSEKSDDKSIKSSLSTKDIIHECSLCYMVFPNEHSLNKHTVICQRKKRQSATKQLKQTDEGLTSEGEKEVILPEENKLQKDDDVTIIVEEVPGSNKEEKLIELTETKVEEKDLITNNSVKTVEVNQIQPKESPKSDEVIEKLETRKSTEVDLKPKAVEELPNLPVKVKKPDDKESKPKVQEIPRKKTPLKDKVASTVTKRHKPNLPPPAVVAEETKPTESSDDDEIRYMLNPDYKFENNEGKLFMKVRANKRNSLQIERPNSKDLVKRRISLQHPPKVPRLKPKSIQNKPVPSSTATNSKTTIKTPKLDPVPSTDSDDSEVKYSFPEPPPEKVSKTSKNPTETAKESPRKPQRKSLAEKRKSLSSIAKRKSLGKAVGAKHKVKTSPLKQVRKRKYSLYIMGAIACEKSASDTR